MTKRRTAGWGGARANAGRPAQHAVASQPHKQRPLLSPRHPVHLLARMAPPASALPVRQIYAALERALHRSLARTDFRVVRLAVTAAGLELVVEADGARALARGMQGLQVSAARALNRRARRSGCVFADRYAMRIMATRAAVREVLGRLPARMMAVAWPHSWLVRVDIAPNVAWLQRSRAGPA